MRVLFRRVATYSDPQAHIEQVRTLYSLLVCVRGVAPQSWKHTVKRRKVGECRVMCEAADGARAACLVWEVGTVQPAPPNMSQIISPPTRVPPRTACPPSSHHAATEPETRTGSVFPPPWSQLVISCASMTVFRKIKATFLRTIAILKCFSIEAQMSFK